MTSFKLFIIPFPWIMNASRENIDESELTIALFFESVFNASFVYCRESVWRLRGNTVHIITTVKHAIWLVNTRAGWDNPAQEIWKLISLRVLRACYGLKIADKKPFQLLKLAENEDKVKYLYNVLYTRIQTSIMSCILVFLFCLRYKFNWNTIFGTRIFLFQFIL